MDSDEVNRILVEITTGKPPAKPDTPEMAEMRRQLIKECKEIEARGHMVDIRE